MIYFLDHIMSRTLTTYELVLFLYRIQGSIIRRLDIPLARSETLEVNEHSSFICEVNDIILGGTQSSSLISWHDVGGVYSWYNHAWLFFGRSVNNDHWHFFWVAQTLVVTLACWQADNSSLETRRTDLLPLFRTILVEPALLTTNTIYSSITIIFFALFRNGSMHRSAKMA